MKHSEYILKALGDSFESCNSCNEIITSPKGNTYVGPVSQLFATGRLSLPPVFTLDSSESFHVFQITDSGEVIHRAATSSRLAATKYMSPDRVCVYPNHER